MSSTTVVRVDPKTLLVGPNVRKEVTLRPEFVASIREHGVLVPILAQETTDGLEVVDGQMRTLAAVDVELADVPVFVQPPTADEAARIVEQIVVNEDRAGLTMPDHVAAIAQLALDFKMPAAEISKRTGASKDAIAAVVTTSKSKAATAAVGREGITLGIAAQMAEAELTEEEIERVARQGYNKDYAVRQIVAERKAAAEVARLTEKVQADGVLIASKPSLGEYNATEKNKHRYLGDLVDATTGKKVTTVNHKTCAGHAAFVGVRGYGNAVEVHYLCTDPSKHGHRDANRATPVKLTAAERARKEIEKQRTAAWPTATEVRLEWVREQLLARRTAPAGWELLAVHDFAQRHQRTWQSGARPALALLQRPAADNDWGTEKTIADWAAEKPINGWRAALALIIARHEEEIATKASWSKASATYLQLLASWGYELSEVEQGVIDDAAATAVADAKAAA
ncbi:ParB/RepB/Spo0J family partition protein [Microbacterium sp. 3J1]|uniref:ParB/RepB/Spo0J family partition protein n=1 Tax=Microbacterium sp. 3J1 TaxID=861269 RepID=UPI000A873247|nr:ParB/RepB/Spo0J family partition protein [Microbacterium sp. 3J1]